MLQDHLEILDICKFLETSKTTIKMDQNNPMQPKVWLWIKRHMQCPRRFQQKRRKITVKVIKLINSSIVSSSGTEIMSGQSAQKKVKPRHQWTKHRQKCLWTRQYEMVTKRTEIELTY